MEKIRADFPILDREVNGHRLVYLDSANTSQKPRQVIDAMREHFERHNAQRGPVGAHARHRGDRGLRGRPGEGGPRSSAPPRADEVVFTKNATEAINLVAYAFLAASLRQDGDPRFRLGPGDEIVITEMEHHSNIVPWQLLCERTGATLRWFGITDQGRLDESTLDELVNERTKLVSMVLVSNILGTANATVAHPRAGPRGRRAVHARRLAGGAAPAGRRGRLRRRLPRLHRAQDARPDRHRRALGPAASCSPRCRRSSAAAR